MNYRSCCLSIFLIFAYIGYIGSPCALGFGWQAYKRQFLSNDGRLIDFYQNKNSHSEGQGYGLLLALANNDKETFEKIWQWTKNNLQMRKGDKLFCWSWGKRSNGFWQVIDYNNASDGDILIAWALYLGWKKWRNPDYEQASKEIVKSIRQQLSLAQNGQILILPGYYGFANKDTVVLNPSYIILSAFQDFCKLDQSKFWNQVTASSITILKKMGFGAWSLPSDWIVWNPNNDQVQPYPKGPNFGYDAWRVFLYASWSKKHLFQNAFERLWNFFNRNGYLPEYVNLQKDTVSLKEGSAGVYAVLAAFAKTLGRYQEAADLSKMADKKMKHNTTDYFSASLYLLSRVRFDK